MKLSKCFLLSLGIGVVTISVAFAETLPLNTENDRASYAMGLNLGESFKKHQVELNASLFYRGLQDGLQQSGGQRLMSEKEMHEAMAAFQKDEVQKMQMQFKQKGTDNKEKGEQFLAENKQKPDVKLLPNGLQYKVIKEGKGGAPKPSNTVVVEYMGKTIDGQIFDQTPAGKTATFKLSAVIPGWTEALSRMQPGAIWEVYIPSELAYGERGVPEVIGPNETLIFKIHLISVK